MNFPDHIFKAYDIRGLVEGELSEELSYRLGRAFVVFLRKKGFDLENKQIVVGRDMRESGLGFQNQVIRGINDEGVHVIDIGLVSTPVFNFASAHYKNHAGGIMVTASHNPSEYNGFKITFGDGLPLGGLTGMDKIRDLVKNYSFLEKSEKGSVSKRDILPDYIEKIFSLVDTKEIKPLKIVVDGGNGMGGAVLPKVLEKLPIEVEYIYIEPDGTFPNHEANPLKLETLRDLQTKVKELGADFGFALDGDADRIGLVDEKGEVVDASFVGALAGFEVLKNKKSGKMFYDLRSSMIIPEVWKKAGGEPEMCMVGHAPIKKLMKENNAIFASELSQHLYYGDLYDLESSDFSLLLFLQMLSRENKTLSELVEPLKKYHHSGEINFEVQDKDAVIAKLEQAYKNIAEEVSYLDGLYMRFDWGWFNVRKSNTEPVLRLNLEAKEKTDMEEKLLEVKEVMGVDG